jgi:hypothetical protein
MELALLVMRNDIVACHKNSDAYIKPTVKPVMKILCEEYVFTSVFSIDYTPEQFNKNT